MVSIGHFNLSSAGDPTSGLLPKIVRRRSWEKAHGEIRIKPIALGCV